MDGDNRPAQIDVTDGGTTDVSTHKNGVEVQRNGTDTQTKTPKTKGNIVIHYLHVIWEWRKIITIEPAVACWIIPSLILYIANENLQLEKSCRVNLALDDLVCSNMINRSINNIDCATLEDMPAGPMASVNSYSIPDIVNATSEMLRPDRILVGAELHDVTVKVCDAERESQKLIAFINGYRAPIAQIFPIIIILFAGGWSDKKGIRKPCILFPIIGELLGCIALFISSIFMRQLPMEFGAILEKILPAMFGGQTLMIMGIYSYLTAVTTEENRTSRFGGFAVFFMILQILSLPLSGDLFNLLGYTKLFLVCIIIYALGILYTVFGLTEVKIAHDEENVTGLENPAFDGELNAEPEQFVNQNNEPKMKSMKISDTPVAGVVAVAEKKNFLREFFDLQLVISCIQVFIKRRANNGRTILFVLAGVYFLFICPAFGEGDYLYGFTRLVLNWNGSAYSYYSTYNTINILIGTSLMTGLFTKFFKITDPMIGIVSTALSIISKPMFAFTKTSALFFAATTVDCFLATRPIAMKSIIAHFVAAEELGRIYSVLGILDAFAAFIIPPIYSFIYFHTVDNFTGAFYLFGEIFMVPALVAFTYVYIVFKKSPISSTNGKSPEDGMVEIDLQVPANNQLNGENGTKHVDQTHM